MSEYKYEGVKGMNMDMTCTPDIGVKFQFEEGGEYEENISDCCKKGFHFVLNPLDVFKYYTPGKSRYFNVQGGGTVSNKDGEDSKIAVTKIKIGTELDLSTVINAGINFIFKKSKEIKKNDRGTAANSGNWGTAITTGKDSVAMVTGYDSKVKGSIGSAIVAAERGKWNGETYPLLSIKAAIVDGEKIKADTFYKVVNGEFVEAEE